MKFTWLTPPSFAIVLMCLTALPLASHAGIKVMQIKEIALDSGVVTVSEVEGEVSTVQLRVKKPAVLKELTVGDTVGVNLEEKNMMVMFDVTTVTAEPGAAAAAPKGLAATVEESRNEANRLACGNNLRQLGLAVQMYAAQNKGRLPRDLGALYADGVIGDPKAVLCPEKPALAAPQDFAKLTPAEKTSWVNANSMFAYVGGGLKANVANPSEFVVVYEKPPTHGDQSVGVSFADAHFERVTPERWRKLQTLQLGNSPRDGKPLRFVDVKNNRNESLEFTAATKDGKAVARSLLQPPGVSLPAGEYVLQVGRQVIPVTIPEASGAPRARQPAESLRRPEWFSNIVVNPNNANVAFSESDGPLMRCYNSRSMFDGPFGYGWTFDYSLQMRKNAQGAFEVTEPDGFVSTYQQTKPGHHRAVVSAFASELVEEEGRVVRRIGGDGYLEKFGRAITEEVYAPDGRLLSVRHVSGDVHEVQYDQKNIKAVVDKTSGKTLYTFACDAAGHVAEMTYPAGQRVGYAYKDRHLAEVTEPGGVKTSYQYSDRHNLIGIAFPDGGRATLKYDEERDWLQSLTAEGTEHRYEYGEQGAGHVWTLRTDQNENQVRWDFHDTLGALVSRIEAIRPSANGELVEREAGPR